MGLTTSGVLARRAGMSVESVRAYADAGLIYSTDRSAAGYRLFTDEASWCVEVTRGLRARTCRPEAGLAGTALGPPRRYLVRGELLALPAGALRGHRRRLASR